MSAWAGPAVLLLMMAGCAAILLRDLLNLARSRRWTRADAMVCADAEHLALKTSRQPRGASTVIFEGPAGPCIARLRYGQFGEDGLLIGSTIPIVFNPAKPSQVEVRYGAGAHALVLIWSGCFVAVLGFGLWQMLATG